MKSILTFVFTVLLTSFVTAQTNPIAPAEFEKKIQTIQPQILDVRTPGEYQSSHIKDALQANWLNPQQFADRVQYLDKTKPVFVYCASGGRSAEAAKWLTQNGFINVEDLKGGLSAWKVDGLPVESVKAEKQLSVKEYLQSTAISSIVLVDFGATWCPPCKKMEPVLDELQKNTSLHFKLVRVDGGTDIDVMKAMKVEAIPTFIIYKDGKETWRKQGVVDEKELSEHLR